MAGWTTGKEAIYFFTAPGKQRHSDPSIYEFATRKNPKNLTIGRRPVWGRDVSPGGRTILYSQFGETGSGLRLVENFR